MKIDIAGVFVDDFSKDEALEKISEFVASGKNHFMVTPYSEMIVFAQRDEAYRKALNQADLSLPDGIGILWASKFLSLPTTHYKLLTGYKLFYSLLAILFNRKYIRSVIHEQITGSRFVLDIAKLAQSKNYSLALVGGKDGVAKNAARELKRKLPNLIINLAISDKPFDPEIIEKINASNSDILLIAYSPPKQEMWLYENCEKLRCKAMIGLGGTFDYLAGKRLQVPDFLHYMGLEWLYRLVTQPWRFKRMWNAIPVFIWTVYKYKTRK
jgi:N-acetylglucosaminyldiphosphoundecaprenol N-acetyl-beta-D-mannosaminyltransferase